MTMPRFSTFLLMLAFCFPATGFAEEIEDGPSVGAVVGDIVFARPLLFAITAVGTALYVVTLPATLLTGTAGDAGEALVVNPAAATFTRCLGCTNEDSYPRTYANSVVSSSDKDKDEFSESSPSLVGIYVKGGYQTVRYFNEGDATGYSAAIGGNVFDSDIAYVDLELSYQNFGDYDENIDHGDGDREKSSLNVNSIGLGGNVGVHLGNYFNLYAKAGINKWKLEQNSTSFEAGEADEKSNSTGQGEDKYYGIGLSANLNSRVNISVEYVLYPISKVTTKDDKITALGANLVLNF